MFDEAALMTALRPFGYQMVTLGTATIEQQIALFAGATHIVAPHGAGLTNIVFAQPETTLVEIFPRSEDTHLDGFMRTKGVEGELTGVPTSLVELGTARDRHLDAQVERERFDDLAR